MVGTVQAKNPNDRSESEYSLVRLKAAANLKIPQVYCEVGFLAIVVSAWTWTMYDTKMIAFFETVTYVSHYTVMFGTFS